MSGLGKGKGKGKGKMDKGAGQGKAKAPPLQDSDEGLSVTDVENDDKGSGSGSLAKDVSSKPNGLIVDTKGNAGSSSPPLNGSDGLEVSTLETTLGTDEWEQTNLGRDDEASAGEGTTLGTDEEETSDNNEVQEETEEHLNGTGEGAGDHYDDDNISNVAVVSRRSTSSKKRKSPPRESKVVVPRLEDVIDVTKPGPFNGPTSEARVRYLELKIKRTESKSQKKRRNRKRKISRGKSDEEIETTSGGSAAPSPTILQAQAQAHTDGDEELARKLQEEEEEARKLQEQDDAALAKMWQKEEQQRGTAGSYSSAAEVGNKREDPKPNEKVKIVPTSPKPSTSKSAHHVLPRTDRDDALSTKKSQEERGTGDSHFPAVNGGDEGKDVSGQKPNNSVKRAPLVPVPYNYAHVHTPTCKSWKDLRLSEEKRAYCINLADTLRDQAELAKKNAQKENMGPPPGKSGTR